MGHLRTALPVALAVLIPALVPPAAPAQTEEFPLLEVGATAPDFSLTGATRWGVLRDRVRLRDFRGKTVVLAFFFRARTPG